MRGAILESYVLSLLQESFASEQDIKDAIKGRNRVILNYKGDPAHGVAPGVRYADIYSYIETKAGNLAIRAYQPMGDTASSVPSWKLFRVDRITNWKSLPYINKEPAEGFNPNGDKQANRIISIANYGNKGQRKVDRHDDEIYQTDTERQMKKNLDDLRTRVLDKKFPPSQSQTNDMSNGEEIYKTETERRMERLMQQLKNPKYIHDFFSEKK